MTFLDRQGEWHDNVAVQAVSLAAAQRLGNPAEQARSHRILGISCARLGSYADADTHLHRALELYQQLGDHAGQGATHYNLATTLERQGRHREALGHAQRSLELPTTGSAKSDSSGKPRVRSGKSRSSYRTRP